MATVIRKQLSKKSPYYISKHRRLELEHFCLQYPEWKAYLSSIKNHGRQDEWSDPTSEEAIKRYEMTKCIELVERCCHLVGDNIYDDLLQSVAYGESWVQISTGRYMTITRNDFYDIYHKFWYVLSQEKHMF